MIFASGSTARIQVQDDDGESLSGCEVTGSLKTLAGATIADLTDVQFVRSDDNKNAVAETAIITFIGTALLETKIVWDDGATTVKKQYVSFE